MKNSERLIRFNDIEMGIDDLSGILLDPALPVSYQRERYYHSINTLRNFLGIFRKPSDPTLALYQEPQPSRLPIQEFTARGLVSEAGMQRIQAERDEVWTSYDTVKYADGSFVDRIKMSYIARYSSYDEMRSDIIQQALGDQDHRIEALLPAVSSEDPKNNHVTLEEIYELNGWELAEIKKRMTGFHFHIENSQRRVGFIKDDSYRDCDSIELIAPQEISSSAVDRVLCATFLPHLKRFDRK